MPVVISVAWELAFIGRSPVRGMIHYRNRIPRGPMPIA